MNQSKTLQELLNDFDTAWAKSRGVWADETFSISECERVTEEARQTDIALLKERDRAIAAVIAAEWEPEVALREGADEARSYLERVEVEMRKRRIYWAE